MSTVKRFPRKRGAPRPKPVCAQCGNAMAKREFDGHHELASGVALNLRVFAYDSDPEKCGPVDLRITEDGLAIGWFGDTTSSVSWSDLLWAMREFLVTEPMVVK